MTLASWALLPSGLLMRPLLIPLSGSSSFSLKDFCKDSGLPMWSRVMSLCGPDYEHSCESVPFPALDHLAVGSRMLAWGAEH